MALKNDNTLWAWGSNDNGQLGTGSASSSGFPTQIGTETNWETIATDSQSSFGIKTDGTFWSWGRNNFGQLGNGTQTNLLVPTQISTDTNWKVAASSFSCTIVLKIDGSLYSWGNNQFGTLGNGTFVNSLIPILITSCNLGTEDFGNAKKASIYPNPVQNRLFVACEETQQYQIYSILGSKISEGMLPVGNAIDCSGLSGGVYLLSLTDGLRNVSTVKFVKQ